MEKVFNNLTRLIKGHKKIVIMTHRNPDFDGMGSAIALQQIIHTFKKESYICKNYHEKDVSLIKAEKYIKKRNIYYQTMPKSKLLNEMDEDTLLIVLDTHIDLIVEEPKLLKKTKNIVIIDHHIESKNCISPSILKYINANLSSVVEFMVNYIKYLNKTIDPLIATFMQIGLEIDTNNYKLKTTEKTFETAAYLIKIGADSVIKHEILQECKSEHLKRNKVIEKSFMISDNMAMCLADGGIYESKDLASISEELLKFENVSASFTIGNLSDNLIGVSARSIGKINVQEYMNTLGGGGHYNNAAAQLKDKTIEEVKDIIIKMIGG